MTNGSSQPEGQSWLLPENLVSAGNAPKLRGSMPWAIFLIGLAIWTVVQTAFVGVPRLTRALPPETDDALTYILKTKQMEECFYQDCLALQDLRSQMSESKTDPAVLSQEALAGSRIFPVYHPFWSAIFLGLKRLGLSLMDVDKVVWMVGPFFFGLSFACLLASLWGLPAAGIALALLAFKVFPDTGLHHVVPSNLTMALAVLLWARIISRKGDAPWSMVIGSLVLVTMHPVGRIYAGIGALFALFIPGSRLSPRRMLAIGAVFLVVGLAHIGPALIRIPGFVNLSMFPATGTPFLTIVRGAAQSFATVVTEILRLESGLFGAMPLFWAAVVFGLLMRDPASRTTIVRLLLIYCVCLVAIFFYVSNHPADVILRVWIPLVVMLFGGVGHAIWYTLRKSVVIIANQRRDHGKVSRIDLQQAWVVIAFAIFLGYSLQSMGAGMEQILATIDHLKNRQALLFPASQPEKLLAEAKPGDRVLYTSIMIMPYYFIHGAMRLGAVYYHPVMEGSEFMGRWLQRADLKFAATYNPTVYHPTFDGVDEHKWWMTAPDYRYSPLSKRRKYQALSREGALHGADFRWIEITPKVVKFPRVLRLLVDNPGDASYMELIPIDDAVGRPSTTRERAAIPGRWSGWVELPLSAEPHAASYRIALPGGRPQFLIQAIVFGNDTNHWPWVQKARVTFMPKDNATGPISISFDPADMLPMPLNKMNIRVLDDTGSSVLFKFDRGSSRTAQEDGLRSPSP